MRRAKLEQILQHPITQKYANRSGMVPAIAVAYHAFHLAKKHHASVDAATRAGFLHDIGHYTWYRNGTMNCIRKMIYMSSKERKELINS
ncbi:hypothetical protein BACCIP111899_00642 [Bacillus rhizoplanae]|uniref:HD domain-containing protein n=1 Tax=Bacillus rhizoplanae TaxID=2880966 RepID=A0ABM8Y707_9BACI|nr:hypothetical protein BACCIP111899_00642 [Bacillus rhizoplanae]